MNQQIATLDTKAFMPEVANSESNCSSNSTSTLAVASAAAQTQTNIGQSEKHPNDLKSSNTEKNLEKLYATRLPWGVIREKVSHASSPSTPLDSTGLTINVNDTNNVDKFTNIEKKKPGEYLMHLLMLNFIQLGSKKLEQIVSGDKRVRKRMLNLQKIAFFKFKSLKGQTVERLFSKKRRLTNGQACNDNG